MSKRNAEPDSEALSLRLKIEELREVIRIAEKQLKETEQEIKLYCEHKFTFELYEGHFASPFDEWAGTEIADSDSPASRICLVCGLKELGKKIVVSGKSLWDFKVLLNNTIKNDHLKNRWNLPEERRLREKISETLKYPLEELLVEMRKLGIEI